MISLARDPAAAPVPAARRRIVGALSVLISISLAGGLGLAWRSTFPTQLSGHINIVGHPTFANFAFQRSFLTYRLLVWELPIVSAVAYLLLCRHGPLRKDVLSDRRGSIAIIERTPVVSRHTATHWLQVLAPATLIAFAVSTRGAVIGEQFARTGVAIGVAYVVAVLGLASLAAPVLRRRGWPSRLVADGESLSLVNGLPPRRCASRQCSSYPGIRWSSRSATNASTGPGFLLGWPG